MNRGSLGIRELKVKIQTELNPARANEPVVEKFGWQFRVRGQGHRGRNGWYLIRQTADFCRWELKYREPSPFSPTLSL